MSVPVFACRGCAMPPLEKKWKGPCPGCGGMWSIIQLRGSDREFPGGMKTEPVEGEMISLADASEDVVEPPRIEVGGRLSAVDELLNRDTPGFFPGSVTLVAGPPGIGKSTLVLQILQRLAMRMLVAYISAEESTKQVAFRSQRLGVFNRRMKILHESDLDVILDKVDDVKPKVVVIDSVQMLLVEDEKGDQMTPGSTASIKRAMDNVRKHAQREGVTYIVIGHVTQDGSIAGGRSGLEHAVDTVIYFDGDENHSGRTLTCKHKNRFGHAGRDSFVYFKMGTKGLTVIEKDDYEEVSRPSQDDSDEDEAEVEEKTTPKTKPKVVSSTSSPSRPRIAPAPIPTAPAAMKPKAVLPIATPASGRPVLKSVPLDEKIEKPKRFSPDPISTWTAPDGTKANVVLAVACDVDGCKGKIDRACTSSSGVKEAGFHQSRVVKSKAKIIIDKPKVVEEPEDVGPDPFMKKFGAPPRVTKVKVKVKAKTKLATAKTKKSKSRTPDLSPVA